MSGDTTHMNTGATAMTIGTTRYILADSLGHLATQFSKAVLRRINQELQAGGWPITSEQWTALVRIWTEDGLTQQALGEQLQKDKTNVARLVAGLEALGYITRRPGQTDRREKTIHLAEAGRKAMPGVVALVQGVLDQACAGIDGHELSLCKRVLHRARLNLLTPPKD